MATSEGSCELQEFLSYMMHHFDDQPNVVEESGGLVGGMLKHLHHNKESPRCHNVVEYFINNRFGKTWLSEEHNGKTFKQFYIIITILKSKLAFGWDSQNTGPHWCHWIYIVVTVVSTFLQKTIRSHSSSEYIYFYSVNNLFCCFFFHLKIATVETKTKFLSW